VAVSIAAGLIGLALLAWMVRKSVTFRPRFDVKRWRSSFADSVPFAISVSAGAVYFYITIVVMSVIASGRETGFFATSFRVVQVGLAIPALALTAVFPILARNAARSQSGLGDGIRKVFDVAVIFGVWLSLVTAIAASVIIDLIAGAKGHPAIAVLRIQGIVLAISFIWASSMFALLAVKRYRPMLIACFAAVPLNIVLSLALVPALGARGGAIADVATESVVAVCLTFALVRALPRDELSARVIPPVLVAAVGAGLAWFLPGGAILRAIVATIVYFAILLALKAIPEEITNTVRRFPVARARA
jgi:O-antigen/teichoic acid export membrane protein